MKIFSLRRLGCGCVLLVLFAVVYPVSYLVLRSPDLGDPDLIHFRYPGAHHAYARSALGKVKLVTFTARETLGQILESKGDLHHDEDRVIRTTVWYGALYRLYRPLERLEESLRMEPVPADGFSAGGARARHAKRGRRFRVTHRRRRGCMDGGPPRRDRSV